MESCYIGTGVAEKEQQQKKAPAKKYIYKNTEGSRLVASFFSRFFSLSFSFLLPAITHISLLIERSALYSYSM